MAPTALPASSAIRRSPWKASAAAGRRTLEAFIGGAAMARAARQLISGGATGYLAACAAREGLDAIEARDIAEGEDAGDAICHTLMERGRRAFAVACVGFVDGLNPSRIVVGGSISDAQGERLLGPARAEVAATAFRTPRSRVQIVHAELGADVGLAGCHPLVIARLGDPAGAAVGQRPSPRRTVDPRAALAPGGINMAVRIGINGFGRIGRQSLKAILERAPELKSLPSTTSSTFR